MASSHVLYDFSDKHRVFVAGDIHGEFGKLVAELDRHQFNSNHDVLVLVGDLVDRGPQSMEALQWIERPYVVRVLGNHELVPDMFIAQLVGIRKMIRWGAKWFLDLSPARQLQVSDKLTDAPYAITIITPQRRRIGIAHGDCLGDWDTMVAHLNDPSPSSHWVRDVCFEGRDAIDYIKLCRQNNATIDRTRVFVKGIDHVFHGHTPMDTILTVANRTWIDTGACFGGPLTVLDIDQFLSG